MNSFGPSWTIRFVSSGFIVLSDQEDNKDSILRHFQIQALDVAKCFRFLVARVIPPFIAVAAMKASSSPVLSAFAYFFTMSRTSSPISCESPTRRYDERDFSIDPLN